MSAIGAVLVNKLTLKYKPAQAFVCYKFCSPYHKVKFVEACCVTSYCWLTKVSFGKT